MRTSPSAYRQAFRVDPASVRRTTVPAGTPTGQPPEPSDDDEDHTDDYLE